MVDHHAIRDGTFSLFVSQSVGAFFSDTSVALKVFSTFEKNTRTNNRYGVGENLSCLKRLANGCVHFGKFDLCRFALVAIPNPQTTI